MAKVLEFPVKKELSEETKQRLYVIAKQYVSLMNEVYEETMSDVTDDKEIGELAELMLYEYIGSVEKAIAELGES